MLMGFQQPSEREREKKIIQSDLICFFPGFNKDTEIKVGKNNKSQ
jgi:hypothetical protein